MNDSNVCCYSGHDSNTMFKVHAGLFENTLDVRNDSGLTFPVLWRYMETHK